MLSDNSTSLELKFVLIALQDVQFALALPIVLSVILMPFMFSQQRLVSMLVLQELSNLTIM